MFSRRYRRSLKYNLFEFYSTTIVYKIQEEEDRLLLAYFDNKTVCIDMNAKLVRRRLLLVYRRVSKIAKACITFIMPVRLSVWNNSATTGMNFIKC